MEQDFSMHANPLVASFKNRLPNLQKPTSFLIKGEWNHYGELHVSCCRRRLKTLNFVINDAAYLDAILTCGERVDGSSLFFH